MYVFVSSLGVCTIVLVVICSNKSFILAFSFSFCLFYMKAFGCVFFYLLALNGFEVLKLFSLIIIG